MNAIEDTIEINEIPSINADGLSSYDVKKRLEDALNNALRRHKSGKPHILSRVLYPVKQLSILGPLFCSALLFASFGVFEADETSFVLPGVRWLVEAILVLLFVGGNAYLITRESILQKYEVVHRLEQCVQEYMKLEAPPPPPSYRNPNRATLRPAGPCAPPPGPLPAPPPTVPCASISLIATCRDGQWQYAPSNTGATGDLIQLVVGEAAPGLGRNAEGYGEGQLLSSGSIFVPSLSDTLKTSRSIDRGLSALAQPFPFPSPAAYPPSASSPSPAPLTLTVPQPQPQPPAPAPAPAPAPDKTGGGPLGLLPVPVAGVGPGPGPGGLSSSVGTTSSNVASLMVARQIAESAGFAPVRSPSINDFESGPSPAPAPAPGLGPGPTATVTNLESNRARSRFELLEATCVGFVEAAVKGAALRPTSALEGHIAVCKTVCMWLVLSAVALCAIVNISRYASWREQFSWTILILQQQIYVALTLLPLSTPMLLLLINAICTAWLGAYYRATQETRSPYSGPKVNEFDTEAHGGSRRSVEVAWSAVWDLFRHVLRADPALLSRSANLLYSLGTTTAVCCVDKAGVVSESVPTPEEVFMFHKDQPEVLELFSDHSSRSGIRFEDPDWRQHIPSLKPLGLACLLNSTCYLSTRTAPPPPSRPPSSLNPPPKLPHHHHQHSTAVVTHDVVRLLTALGCSHDEEYHTRALHSTSMMNTCLCGLGREIGFTDGAVDMYKRRKEIHIVEPYMVYDDEPSDGSGKGSSYAQPPHVVSVLVEDRSGGWQMFSKGNPNMVLGQCSHFWDGEQVRELGEEESRAILSEYHKWRHDGDFNCIAFVYTPIPARLVPLLATEPHVCYMLVTRDGKMEMVEVKRASSRRGTGMSSRLKGSTTPFLQMQNKKELTDAIIDIHTGGVFLGMAALRLQPRHEVADLVEQLRSAGIRFIFMSEDNERQTKSFGEKLGLETDWNCCISLRDPNASTAPSNPAGPTPGPGPGSAAPHVTEHVVEAQPVDREASNDVDVTATARQAVMSEEQQQQQQQQDEQEKDPSTALGPPSRPVAPNSPGSGSAAGEVSEAVVGGPGMMGGVGDGVKVKLPRGIHAVRPHIDKVDNVPLLVSLFADAEAPAAREMVEILQEHGEVVLCVGSSLRPSNVALFAQSDLAMAIDPFPPYRCIRMPNANPNPVPAQFLPSPRPSSSAPAAPRKSIAEYLHLPSLHQTHSQNPSPGGSTQSALHTHNSVQPPRSHMPRPPTPPHTKNRSRMTRLDDLGHALNTLPCSLVMNAEVDRNLCDIVQVLHEGRRMLSNARQALLFLLASHLALFLIVVVAALALMPTILTAYQILWLVCVPVPLLSLSMLASPSDANVFKRMPDKNSHGVFRDWPRFLAYFGVRFCPTVGLCLFIYVWTLRGTWSWFLDQPVSWNDIAGGTALAAQCANSEAGRTIRLAMVYAQNATMFMFVLYLCVISASFLHRVVDLRTFRPYQNPLWLVAVALAVLFQGTFYAVSVEAANGAGAGQVFFPQNMVWYGLVLLLIAAPVMLVVVDEVAKKHDRKRFARYHKRLWLEFNTKLGMHSPD